MRGRCIGVVGSGFLTVAAGLAASGGSAIPVRATPALELRPVAGDGVIAWAQARARVDRTIVLVQRGSGPVFRVNARGTTGAPGGLSGATLAYEERRRGRSDIRFFALVTRRRFAPPAGVNTRRWRESEPSLSGQWLLFKRITDRLQLILLLNMKTGEQIHVAQALPAARGFDVGQVNGNYGVWSMPGAIGRYDIARRSRSMITALPEHRIFAPSVSARGVLYYAQALSIQRCGRTSIVRSPASRLNPPVLTTLPAGYTVGSTYAVDGAATTTVYFSRVSCDRHAADVYKVIDSPSPPPVVR
jgi:hypothetical protein